MSDLISVQPEVLRRHAARVDSLTASVTQCMDAAASMNLGGGAFGIMCAFLVPPASAVSGIARSSISAAEGMLGRSATELRGLADDFERAEERVSGTLRDATAQLGGL